MKKCPRCGKESYSWTHNDKYNKDTKTTEDICMKCDEELNKNALKDKLELIKEPKDFESWSEQDMAKSFVRQFVSYQKEPTKEKLNKIRTLWYWAVHASHSLSATMSEVFKWQDFDLEAERKKYKENKE